MFWKSHSLVAIANHRCCAFLLTPGPSDCSEAETEPQGYSAPMPIPRKNLTKRRYSFRRRIESKKDTSSQQAYSASHQRCHALQKRRQISLRIELQYLPQSSERTRFIRPSHILSSMIDDAHHPELPSNFVRDPTWNPKRCQRLQPPPEAWDCSPKVSIPNTVPAKVTLV